MSNFSKLVEKDSSWDKAKDSVSKLTVKSLSVEQSPDMVFFSSVSNNTLRFMQRLDRSSVRIPLRTRVEGMIEVSRPFVLVVPTYGGGDHSAAVPKQVVQFLSLGKNVENLRGVIPSGNMNFGEHYCLAGKVISEKFGVPLLYRFELLGNRRDVKNISNGMNLFLGEAPKVVANDHDIAVVNIMRQPTGTADNSNTKHVASKAELRALEAVQAPITRQIDVVETLSDIAMAEQSV